MLCYFKIQDGETEDSPLKMEICGSNTPPDFVSNGNALRVSIEVLSEVYYTFNEMEAHYSVLDNGTPINKSQRILIIICLCFSLWRCFEWLTWRICISKLHKTITFKFNVYLGNRSVTW